MKKVLFILISFLFACTISVDAIYIVHQSEPALNCFSDIKTARCLGTGPIEVFVEFEGPVKF